MSILDAIILVPILFGAYKGFQKGLVMELVTIIAFLLATIASFKLLYVGVALLEPYLGKNESVLPVVSFVIIFVLVIYLVTLLGKGLKKVLDITLLGKLDDLAGATLGALKWSFAFSVILWLLHSSNILGEELTEGSITFPYFVNYGPKVLDFCSALMPYAKDTVESVKDLIQID